MVTHPPSPYFCSQASRLAGEACFGTSVNADIWLLIEVPEAWGPKAVAQSSMPQSVKQHLASLSQISKRIRIQLIKQEPREKWPHQVFIGFTNEIAQRVINFKINSYEELLKLNAVSLIEGRLDLEYHEIHLPLYIVCTHGRHDKCCAKFGYATYKYMHSIAPGNVWQTSHMGGDRFASNVMSFPTGVYYGHVDESAANGIIEAESSHEIYLENYRGRTCYGKYAQVAEYFIRRESGIRAAGELRRESVRSNNEKTKWIASFISTTEGKRFSVIFEQRRSKRKALLTCSASDEKTPVEYHLIEYNENGAELTIE